jgi:hypothetical protein
LSGSRSDHGLSGLTVVLTGAAGGIERTLANM